ncbi:hypothetical protein [Sporolactobacillus terrae]|uniref:hypothetical protein n=1 Tax=Sporolactobacillus terrae TaxID=269673 RepID=UPI001CC14087|nr:hypothetical protein [Sporolactobacillus terrae]UAK17547.1 hypothetical protein K7399_06370 [Sporolactobacillus terrae]
MALKKLYSKEVYGKQLTFNDAYFEIESLQGYKQMITIYVNVYDNDQKQNVIDKLSFQYVPDINDDAKNNFKQGYEFIKTQPGFENAIDVLEEGQTA